MREEGCACVCVCARVLSCVPLFETPWTIAHQAPLSIRFSRQEYGSGFPCCLPGDLLDPGIELMSLMAPALAGRFFTTVPPGKPGRRGGSSQTNKGVVPYHQNVKSAVKYTLQGQTDWGWTLPCHVPAVRTWVCPLSPVWFNFLNCNVRMKRLVKMDKSVHVDHWTDATGL